MSEITDHLREIAIAGLEADLREARDRIAAMRVEWGAEVAALTAQLRHAQDLLDAARARIAKLENAYAPR